MLGAPLVLRDEPLTAVVPWQDPGTNWRYRYWCAPRVPTIVRPVETSPFNPVTAELARLPERLESLLATSTEARWLERPAPGEWSAKEIAGHLADAARIYHERLRQILSEDRPQLARYDEVRLASEHSYQQADLGETLRSVRTWRERTVALLASLPSPAWSRIGVHEETGEITLLQIAAHMVEHEADHLRGIARALGAMSVSAAV